jgi:purine-cytosine permease-like protein
MKGYGVMTLVYKCANTVILLLITLIYVNVFRAHRRYVTIAQQMIDMEKEHAYIAMARLILNAIAYFVTIVNDIKIYFKKRMSVKTNTYFVKCFW